MTAAEPLRIALLTTGPRPVARAFAEFPERPVGIVEWDLPPPVRPAPVALARTLAGRARALARGRRFSSARQLCRAHGLAHAAIDKRDPEALRRTLEAWRADLVITSGCAIVPMDALGGLAAGAINLHPSALPAWRGANPLFWQVATGEPRLAASVHRLAAGSDTGAVLGVTDVERPRGASREALLEIADGELGVALLHRVVRALAAEPGLAGTVQPATSPTPYARAVPDAAAAVPLDALSPERAWDLARYLGHCPAGWLAGLGVRTRVRWRALGPPRGDGARTTDPAAPWRAERRGATLRLVRGKAFFALAPRP